MRRSTLLLVTLGVVEVLILLGGVFMLMQVAGGHWNTPDPREAVRRITTVIGAAIPLVAFFFLVIAIPMRRKGL